MSTIAAAGRIPGRNTRTSERGGTVLTQTLRVTTRFLALLVALLVALRVRRACASSERQNGRPAQRDLQLVSEVEAATGLSGPLEGSSGAHIESGNRL